MDDGVDDPEPPSELTIDLPLGRQGRHTNNARFLTKKH